MKKIITICTLLAAFSVGSASANETQFDKLVAEDGSKFRSFFLNKFASVEVTDYINGVYAIDAKSREQWEEIEDFPPYELSIDEGQELFEKPFANGKNYASCFANDGINVRKNYPYYDLELSKVMTLELAINMCREANGEKPLGYKKGDIALLSAYMAYTSRDETFNIGVPNQAAYDAYLDGKKFFYSKRGQLNLACSDCHLVAAGQKLRADIPSPALGHTTGFPVYRSKWGGLGTLHRRYAGCNKNVRAQPFSAQGEEYRNLEFFQSLMNQGLVLNGPSARK